MELHKYQQETVTAVVDQLTSGGGAAILADPGLGKTAMALETLKRLGGQTLLVAPLRVCQSVWRQENSKWGYGFSIGLVHGSAKKRMAVLEEDHDIYLMTPDGAKWFEKEYDCDLDNLVIDESTAYKGWGSQRSKSMRRLCKSFKTRLLLTGTPVPQSLIDWHGQAYLLDFGKRFGSTCKAFRSEWCRQGGFQGRVWEFSGDVKAFEQRMGENCHRLEANDHLDMPDLIINDIECFMDPKQRAAYKSLEDDLFAQIDGGMVELMSPGSVYQKCRQAANGFVYGKDGETLFIHDEKQQVVTSLLNEIGNKPVLFGHMFREDERRMVEDFGCASISGSCPNNRLLSIIDDWNANQLTRLTVQPAAASHGLNLQYSGCRHLIWLALPNQSELYTQFIARIYRQGQVHGSVIVHRLFMGNTVEEIAKDRLDGKISDQASLLENLKNYRTKVG